MEKFYISKPDKAPVLPKKGNSCFLVFVFFLTLPVYEVPIAGTGIGLVLWIMTSDAAFFVRSWAGYHQHMCREGLMRALVAQTLHIPKKGLCSRLALDQFPGNELWALGIFCMIGVFLYALSLRPCNTSVLRQFMLTSVMYGEHVVLLWEAGVWRAEVSCKGAACLRDWSLIKTLDTEA